MIDIEFENLVAAYGANPARWPEARRAAGEQYMISNPATETLLRNEAKLDAALDLVIAPEPSDILKARIMKDATGNVSQAPSIKPERKQHWKIAAAFVAVLAVGGLTYSVYTTTAETESETTAWLEAANELGVSDIYDWVEGTE